MSRGASRPAVSYNILLAASGPKWNLMEHCPGLRPDKAPWPTCVHGQLAERTSACPVLSADAESLLHCPAPHAKRLTAVYVQIR